MAQLTPMMKQYLQLKEKYQDCILFFRLGDFYEMFFNDAKLASRELEITLTGRDCGLEERAPMCGVPHHSAHSYIAKLIKKGYKVAICEQTEDPSVAKGIVKREVVRIITPGTIIDQSMLDEKTNNYILTIYFSEDQYGIAYADISTGELRTTWIEGNSTSRLVDELSKIQPREILVNGNFFMETKLVKLIESRLNVSVNEYHDWSFSARNAEMRIRNHFKVATVEGLGLIDKPLCVSAVGALLEYLEETQKVALSHIDRVDIYLVEDYMLMDASTRRNLELIETLRTKEKKGSLLWLLDKTKTAMGGRMLRRWVEQPLINPEDINGRLDGVEELKSSVMLMDQIKDYTSRIYDMERLMSRIVYGNANARDLLSLKQSLEVLPGLKEVLSGCISTILSNIRNNMDLLEDILDLINASIHHDPPVGVKEGNIIRDGYDKEIDKLRKASREGKQWIASLEKEERARTGIKSLKVGFNKVFGYYIEITKANLSQVPEDYIRKQTLTSAERYITPELKEIEDTILGAQEKVMELEYQIFMKIRRDVAGEVERIKKTSRYVAILDVLCSLARVSAENGYIRPRVNEGFSIEIKDGRHPVVEKMLGINSFVPNDTFLDCGDNRLCIITGPNMAGKSTFMRQVALIVLMAQIGCFVPASYLKLGVVDRIFTRVGASDDLAAGQSTFMVEMSELANILNNATRKSLLILDEIGRGTSTFDGLSIAWAVIEHVTEESILGARTLFATHYHQLTELEGKLEGVKNYCIAVKEKGEDIIFLRKVIRGGADQSYGIQVAGLAGLPRSVIVRAGEILQKLEESDIAKNGKKVSKKDEPEQMDFFTYKYRHIVKELTSIDINSLTPLQALNKLNVLRKNVETLAGEEV